jgi:hypothetical protein
MCRLPSSGAERPERRPPGLLEQDRGLVEREPAAAQFGGQLRRPQPGGLPGFLQLFAHRVVDPAGEDVLLSRDHDLVDECRDLVPPLFDARRQ